MKRQGFILFLLLLLSACATYEAKYSEPFQTNIADTEKETAHTFYLIGDAGKSPHGNAESCP